MVVVCGGFPSLGIAGVRLFIACVFMDLANFLGLEVLSSTFCRAQFVDRYCLNLVLS